MPFDYSRPPPDLLLAESAPGMVAAAVHRKARWDRLGGLGLGR